MNVITFLSEIIFTSLENNFNSFLKRTKFMQVLCQRQTTNIFLKRHLKTFTTPLVKSERREKF